MRPDLSSAVVAALLIFAPQLSNAQETEPNTNDQAPRTLFGGQGKMTHGGWAAPTASYTQMLKQDAMLVGLRGGWLVNHRLTIGLAGQGMVTSLGNEAYDSAILETGSLPRRSGRFNMGYGGLLIEPVIAYKSPIHISFPIVIGAGGCAYTTEFPWNDEHHDGTDDHYDFNYRDDAAAFFVIEPGVELEMNLIPFLRIGVGASYRYTTDIDLPGTAKDALHGITTGVSIKVGKF
ncbi:MAG TPA: hypothetical protein PLE78_03220 [Flavobacteriales bacterium]|nr:hypothetical protein [Flavobacteriales bacterium]HQV74475.1 hypothetical protein [Flavobacteriales bacterium]HQW40021.1 hypothetical protein [Flavobacteriales bacterium]